MKFLKTSIFALVLGLATLASDKSYAEDKIWTAGIDQGYASQYLWRATALHNDGYQGDVYVTLWDMLTFNVWYDAAAKDTSGAKTGEAYEIDYTIDLAYSVDEWSFNVGHIIYDFPQTAAGSPSSTSEVYLAIAYDTILAPALGIYYDYDQVDGIYFQFDLGHSIELSESAALNFGASVGYAIDEGTGSTWSYYDKNSGFTSFDFSASIDFSMAPVSEALSNVTVSPSAFYTSRTSSMILGNQAGSPAVGNDDFVAAINVNLEF